MEYLILIGIILFPAVVCAIYELVTFRRIWIKGESLTRHLASCGIYFLFLMVSFTNELLDTYMSSTCIWGEGPPPCPMYFYYVADFINHWLLFVLFAIAVLVQVAYLYFISNKIRLTD